MILKQTKKNAYLVSHLGAGVNVKAQVVKRQLGGLFLQLPGERDLPAMRQKHTVLCTSSLVFNCSVQIHSTAEVTVEERRSLKKNNKIHNTARYALRCIVYCCQIHTDM